MYAHGRSDCFRGVQPDGPAQRKRCPQHRRIGNGAKPQGEISRWLVEPEAHRTGGERRQLKKSYAFYNSSSKAGKNDRKTGRAKRAARFRDEQRKPLEPTQRGSRAPAPIWEQRQSSARPLPARRRVSAPLYFPHTETAQMAERDYVLGTHDDEIYRLGYQHRVWRPRALDAWARAHIGDGCKVIDFGAG